MTNKQQLKAWHKAAMKVLEECCPEELRDSSVGGCLLVRTAPGLGWAKLFGSETRWSKIAAANDRYVEEASLPALEALIRSVEEAASGN